MTVPVHPLLSGLLRLPSMAYGGAVGLRNRYYDRPGAARRAELPVLSVGNITVGGTGKTPIVAWLSRQLLDRGLRPAVVSRGYGGRAGRGPLLVSRGSGPLAGPRECGDEPYLLAAANPGLLVVVGADRVAGAGLAHRERADVVLLDDGFQHRRLARDLDIVLLDSSNPFGNHRMLPAGRLREPLHALGRADVVIITRSRHGESFETIERTVARLAPDVLLLRAGHRSLGFFDPAGKQADRPAGAVAFCGIGNPGRFRTDLASAGVELVEFRTFHDHHRYDPAELRELDSLARSHGVALVTTEKDLVRITGDAGISIGDRLLAFRIEAEFYEPERLLQRILPLVGGQSAG